MIFWQVGMYNPAAQVIINEQSINRLEKICFLMDEDIKTLCRNIKRLGGVATRDGGGANPGHMISQLTEKNIMLTA